MVIHGEYTHSVCRCIQFFACIEKLHYLLWYDWHICFVHFSQAMNFQMFVDFPTSQDEEPHASQDDEVSDMAPSGVSDNMWDLWSVWVFRSLYSKQLSGDDPVDASEMCVRHQKIERFTAFQLLNRIWKKPGTVLSHITQLVHHPTRAPPNPPRTYWNRTPFWAELRQFTKKRPTSRCQVVSEKKRRRGSVENLDKKDGGGDNWRLFPEEITRCILESWSWSGTNWFHFAYMLFLLNWLLCISGQSRSDQL